MFVLAGNEPQAASPALVIGGSTFVLAGNKPFPGRIRTGYRHKLRIPLNQASDNPEGTGKTKQEILLVRNPKPRSGSG